MSKEGEGDTEGKSPKPTTRSLLINLACLISSAYGLSTGTKIHLPHNLIQAGHRQFLTNIGVGITIINNVANILNWILRNCRFVTDNRILSIFNFVARHITLPIALVLESIIPAVYWPLRLFALDLIMQGVKDGRSPVPYMTDVCCHLFPIIFLLLDHYFSGCGQKFNISNISGFVMVNALGLAYYKWLDHLIGPAKGQVYPYPFLDVEEPYRTIIFITITSITWFIYLLYQRFPPKSRQTSKGNAKKTD